MSAVSAGAGTYSAVGGETGRGTTGGVGVGAGGTNGAAGVVAFDSTVFSCNRNQPPDCSKAAPSIAELWPPNHKFVGINVLGVTDADGDPITITIDSIRQDEVVAGNL